MVDQKENKLADSSLRVNTNMGLLTQEKEMFQCTRVEQPALLGEVEHALSQRCKEFVTQPI